MDAAYQFTDFIAQAEYGDLPKEVVQLVKKDFIDTLGNILAGSRDRVTMLLLEHLLEIGGTEESTVITHGIKLPVAEAAFCNASMGFVLDYDDIHEPATLHAGTVIIPTALAVAERIGRVSGKEIIAAVSVALEVVSRLGMHMVRRHSHHIMGGWDYTALLGYFSAALVTAKLLQLDKDQIHNALGIAYHQAAGNSLSAMEKADTKILGPGMAARGGILSALLARKGLTGAKSVFNDKDISLSTQYNMGCDSIAMTENLGRQYSLLGLGFKAYPCCRLTHRYIDAVLNLVTAHDITPQDIKEIQLTACKIVQPLCKPTPENICPANKTAAQFSIPWVAACAAVQRKVAIGEFEAEALQDQSILDMAAKVTCRLDPEYIDVNDPAPVRIITDREVFETTLTHPYGSPENPISYDHIKAKFLDCASFGWSGFTLEKGYRIIESVESLDAIRDITEFLKILQ